MSITLARLSRIKLIPIRNACPPNHVPFERRRGGRQCASACRASGWQWDAIPILLFKWCANPRGAWNWVSQIISFSPSAAYPIPPLEMHFVRCMSIILRRSRIKMLKHLLGFCPRSKVTRIFSQNRRRVCNSRFKVFSCHSLEMVGPFPRFTSLILFFPLCQIHLSPFGMGHVEKMSESALIFLLCFFSVLIRVHCSPFSSFLVWVSHTMQKLSRVGLGLLRKYVFPILISIRPGVYQREDWWSGWAQ